MDKARQRKLEARQRRLDSLANFGAASQEPKEYPGHRVSEKRLSKIYRKIGIQTIPDDTQTESVKVIGTKKHEKNLSGVSKKTTVKGKEKKNG